MVKGIRNIAKILMLLLVLAGAATDVAAKVTYHILTLPFTTKQDDGTNRGTYIVEALRCTSDELTVNLPDYFKSPLVVPGSFRYYAADKVTVNGGTGTRSQIYQYIITTYDTYTIPNAADSLTTGSAIADNSHVYVTYQYNPATSPLKLDCSEDYNIMLGNRFIGFNKARNNRIGAVLASNLTNEHLVSNDFILVANSGFDSNNYFHFRFWYDGNDPYNITIRTSYVGDGTFMESDKALNKTVKKYYRGSSLFCKGNADGKDNLWMASDDNVQYTQTNAAGAVTSVPKPGYYRGGPNGQSEMNPIWNSFAILQPDPEEGYIYIGTKMNSNGNNWQPNANGQYFYLVGNNEKGKNPKFKLQTPANVEKSKPYPIDTFTYKVTTPLSNTVISVDVYMSNYSETADPLSYIPDGIKRKYVTFTGTYREASLTNEITTFAQATANGKVIWLKYTSDMPFESLSSIGSYDNARWYTIRMNGDQETQYIASYVDGSNVFHTGGGSNSDLHYGENTPKAKVAFVGDPFELKIISHKASENITVGRAGEFGDPATADNRYIGCASASADGTLLSAVTGSSDISSWEIVYENTQMGTMILRQLGSVEDPKYIGWNYSDANRPITYSSSGSRIRVVELDKKNYIYHIVRSDGTIAVKATEAQDVGRRLKYAAIPEVIRSPFIDPSKYTATLKFYWTKEAAVTGTDVNRHSHAPYDPATEGYNIYVRYTCSNNLSERNYNVRLNGQYLYYDSGDIKSNASPEATTAYEWYLDLNDPYSMKVKNIASNQFVKVTGAWSNNQALGWDIEANASLYIAKSSTIEGIYEVMAATGDDIDASTTYYDIGRPAANTVKMYNNATYPHGYAQIRFLLTPTDAATVDYHLIDKAGTELLVVRSRREDLFFPADYRSPLVETYHYWTTSACNVELTNLASATVVEGVKQVYVTYTTSRRINLQKGVMYLLKFEAGDSFHQEDGADGQTASAIQAVYPYCNGDCNFFVYGQAEYELQQQGAASTRTRWAWYLESDNNDPYHVKICSRQTETFSDAENRGYFRTYTENYGGANHVVTNLAWPGITGKQGTEYMVLGAVGQYQLMTTYKVDVNNDGDTSDPEDERQVVKAFEQYWKTFDTLRKKIFGDPAKTLSPEDPSTVPATPCYDVTTAAGESSNRDYLVNEKGYHYYTMWAYAKRWNGYNISGAKSKGWEEIEHWYQTVNMGEGYFDFVPVTIEPALILLDQHGWEIMRKPLPSSPDDPTKESKYEAIRPYNSPMVKEYYFWGSAKKRSGFHQYYNLSGQMKVDGVNYTSTDLTKLPSYYNSNGTRNATIFDKKGNQLDQYVTYVAKDEYAQSYDPATQTGAKFLIQQGSDYYASTSGGASVEKSAVADPGGLSQTIINANGIITDNNLWYIKPNSDIDIEMGYYDAEKYPGGHEHSWTNDYAGSVTKSGFNSNGFDPYNIQISNAQYPAKYFVTDATGAKIDNGAWLGNSSGSTVALDAEASVAAIGHDSRAMLITNATFMAVQDEDGNMQLMPRFDQTQRVSSFTSLVEDRIGDAVKMPETYTQFFRPAVYNYHIIDNSGNEALRYQSGGDLVPHMADHFKSPVAKDFAFYKEEACTNEITASFAEAGKTDATNDIYIRYAYDADADVNHILKGKWFTMQLDKKDAIYSDGIKEGSDKPVTIDGSERTWQWKLLETPQTEPDPYAVYLYNRSQNEGTKATNTCFALLAHTSGDYALAEAGTGNYTYTFLNGTSMTTSVAATTATETDFKSTSCTFSETGSQVKFIDDVEHTYTYRVYTNSLNFAISATQNQATASINEFVPVLPDEIMTPLLHSDQFLYYEKETDMGNAAKELQYLYGLYDDDIYVRYTAYDEKLSSYLVPNEKALVGGHAARGANSNDTYLGLSGNLIYNIIWWNDNMMKSDGSSIANGGSKALQTVEDYEWMFEGNDPYAIKVKSVKENKYVYNSSSNTCTLSDANATTFMLLNKDNYDYGILQVTGDANSRKWTGFGNSLTAAANTDPTQYVIYALATHKVIYHLVLANTGSKTASIPYRADQTMPATPVAWNSGTDTKQFDGTTQRDLTTGSGATYQLGSTINGQTYSFDAGAISLGAQLTCPSVFYRPNVVYHYIVEGVYSNDACTTPVSEMNDKYKGYEIEKMGDNVDLLGTTMRINIVYDFDGDLESNTGAGFVVDVADNQWYTFETEDVEHTPWLAQFTNAWGLEVKQGRTLHYTNDYLWSPLGDPYGFKMYNRYIYKTSSETTRVLMLTAAPANNGTLTMKIPDLPTDMNRDIFELLSGGHDGTFLVHPMLNMTGTQYYFKINNEGVVKLSATGSEWSFGLSEELMQPYYDRAGYLGGLNETGVAAYETAAAVSDPAERLMELQKVVYDDANIIAFTPGYYRMHSPEGIVGIDPVRYASGYTHKLELTAGAGSTPIPMHFYEKVGVETTYDVLPSKDGLSTGVGFTTTEATRGEMPIPAVEYDPASIFYITGTYNAATISTQGLYVEEEHMTATAGNATSFYLMDIGGGVFLIHDGVTPASRKYFCYDQTDAAHIYDLKFIHDCHTDHAKWCIQPANMQGLSIKTNSGGDEGTYGTTYNYCSLYLPFDILLPEGDVTPQPGLERERTYWAFICDDHNSLWSPPNDLHPKPIGRYLTAAYGTYKGENRFVPAGTPVLLAMWDQSNTVNVTLPNSSPSASLTTGLTYTYKDNGGVSCNNILSGQYLEQKLALTSSDRIYAFGLPFTGTFSLDPATGDVTATLPTQDNHGLGFYLNANPNKELGISRSNWARSNWYVLGNKVYYHGVIAPSSAPAHNDLGYIPVNFGDDEDENQSEQPQPGDPQSDQSGANQAVKRLINGQIIILRNGERYDITGRKL